MKKIKLLFSFALIIATIANGFAQTLTPELRVALQKTLENRNLKIRGASAAISFPDDSIWTGVRGYSSDSVKIDSSMLFIVASITKHFIGPLVVKLAEEGLLSLDDSIYHWIPSFNNIDSTITVKQLLTHTSGLGGGYMPAYSASADKIWTTAEILQHAEQPVFHPGNAISYSNTAFTVLTMIIDSITHKPVENVLREKILEPFELVRTFFYPFEDYNGSVAHPWTEGPGAYDYFSHYSMSWIKGSGNMLATPYDLATWSKNLMKGKFLNEQNVLELMTPKTNSINIGSGAFGTIAKNVQFSYGTWCLTDNFNLIDGPVTLFGHMGMHLKTISFLFYSPEKDISIAVCVNDGSEGDYSYPMLQHLFQTFLSGKATTDIIRDLNQEFTISSDYSQGEIVDTIAINLDEYDYSSIRFMNRNFGSVATNAFSIDNEGIIRVNDNTLLKGRNFLNLEFQTYPVDSMAYLVERGVVKINIQQVEDIRTKKDKLFSIYPNPTHGYLNIDFNGSLSQNYQIVIFDISGKQVMQKALENTGSNQNIDVSSLEKGYYIISVNDKTGKIIGSQGILIY